MLAQVLGFTLTRTLPSKVLFGVLTGTYQVCIGVVRNNSGQIMAHLVNGVSPLSVTQPVNSALGAIKTYQLHRLGRDVTQIGAGMTQLNQTVGAMSENLAEVKRAVGATGETVDVLLAATNH